MKNVHLLPTDKPSRLFKDDSQILNLNIHSLIKGIFTNGVGSNQHIYITSDEPLKKGDWLLSKEGIVHNNSGWNFGDKKIILTTDPDLIKDGVQAIDNAFLEWFVKNPSCEFVEVKIDCDICALECTTYKCPNLFYKIIIPQEEPKQDLEKEMSMLPLGTRNLKYKIIISQEDTKQEKCIYCNNKGYINNHIGSVKIDCLHCNTAEKPKQETIEEAAEKYAEGFEYNQPSEHGLFVNSFQGFISGANWQAKRMYSEEEVKEILMKTDRFLRADLDLWFEQHKKK